VRPRASAHATTYMKTSYVGNLSLGLRLRRRSRAVGRFVRPGARSPRIAAGSSGSGKSTLLNLVAGILPSQSGSIVIDGPDVARLSPRAADAWRAGHIGLLPQQLAVAVAAPWMADDEDFAGSGWELLAQEASLPRLALAIGCIAAAIPAWRAYRIDTARTWPDNSGEIMTPFFLSGAGRTALTLASTLFATQSAHAQAHPPGEQWRRLCNDF
jgi:hypothetical protein